jgi:hypothetical protein
MPKRMTFDLDQNIRLPGMAGGGMLENVSYSVLHRLFGEPRVTKPGRVGWSFIEHERGTPVVLADSSWLTAVHRMEEPHTWWINVPRSQRRGQELTGDRLGDAFRDWVIGEIRAFGVQPVPAEIARKEPFVSSGLFDGQGDPTTFARAIAAQASADLRKRFDELARIGGREQALSVLAIAFRHATGESWVRTAATPTEPGEDDLAPSSDDTRGGAN